jgi:hypothetical protein
MTSSSYTLATEDEEYYLKEEIDEEAMSHHHNFLSHQDMNHGDDALSNSRTMSIGDDSATEASTSSEGTFADETVVGKENDNNDDKDTESRSNSNNNNSSSNISHESHLDSPTSIPDTATLSPSLSSSLPSKYQTRTITTTSFMVLKHLFEPMNSLSERSSSSSGEAKFNPSLLPACILISNPTPDTLGRFLNASATVASGNISADDSINEVGWDILPPSPMTNNDKSTVFFVSNTSQYVKGIVDYMADYSNTSVVGESDFTLKQHIYNQ